jgi:UDP-N-acetylmuramate: L-alanyl-gamma-D-glutamyl-meso-diaminopimelate ligase
VVQHLKTHGREAHHAPTNAEILEKLIVNTLPVANVSKARTVVFFTNGSFDGIIGKFVAAAH